MAKALFQIVLLVFFFANTASAQESSIQLGTQIPLMYSVGYEFDLSNKISFNTQIGILTKPFDVTILEILKYTGTEEPIVNTIGEAFKFGFIFQPTIKINIKRNYIGAYYSYYSLVAEETPAYLIESYYDIYLPRRTKNIANEFKINSRLHNVGLLIGRRFKFKNPGFELKLELAFAKTFKSKSKLSSEFGDVSMASSLIDNELDYYYVNYGYFPSFNVFIVKKITKRSSSNR